MITKEEFLKALEIVNNYKIQISKEFEEMKKELGKKNFNYLPVTKDTLITETYLSVRALNALHAYSLNHIEEIKDLKWSWDFCEVKVGHFENIKKQELHKFRNFGKKSIEEIEKMFFEAGMILK